MCEAEIKRVTNEEWKAQLKQAAEKLRTVGFIKGFSPLKLYLTSLIIALVFWWVWFSEMSVLSVILPVACGLLTTHLYARRLHYRFKNSEILEKLLNQQVDIGSLEMHVPRPFRKHVEAGLNLDDDLRIFLKHLDWFMLPPKNIHWITWVLSDKHPSVSVLGIFAIIVVVGVCGFLLLIGLLYFSWEFPYFRDLFEKWIFIAGFYIYTVGLASLTLRNQLNQNTVLRKLEK